MAKTQTIRLTKAEIIQQRDMQVRGEALGMALQFCGTKPPGGIEDVIRVADKIYSFLSKGAVPPEPVLEDVSTGKVRQLRDDQAAPRGA